MFRDANGVPHVRAHDEADALFALGFVHAQDRLAQMLWLLRLARGRTAEIVGREGLPADRLARTLDLGGLADRQFGELDRGTRALLIAYARGVNAHLERIRDGQVAAPVARAAPARFRSRTGSPRTVSPCSSSTPGAWRTRSR